MDQATEKELVTGAALSEASVNSGAPLPVDNSVTMAPVPRPSPSSQEVSEVDETSSDSTLTPATADPSITAEDARAKRFTFLLTQSEIFAHFVKTELSEEDMLGNKKALKKAKAKLLLAGDLDQSKMTVDISNNSTKDRTYPVFTSTPTFIKNGQMKDYQIRGLNWLISLYQNGVNGILADEMGLGKTLQTIALLGYLKSRCRSPGPHLIVAPKSTINNWVKEFSRWYPALKTVPLIGDKADRDNLLKTLHKGRWHVCITSYEVVSIELSYLKSIDWVYVVIDEAQRIKNENSLLAKNMRRLKSTHRLLLTGTPLQNNLHELWSLLNYLLPELFSSSDDFDSWFDTNHCLGDETVVNRLHGILQPFLLRRVKSDVEKSLLPKKELKVYVEMTQLQREWYRNILLGEIEILKADGNTSKKCLSNLLVQLRKVCNHPYLIQGVETGPPFTTEQHIVTSCGKLLVLDKLLFKLKAEGSRVLLFSQFTTLLDIIQDYCIWKGYSYCRLDGQTRHGDRQDQINAFNAATADYFIFLLSTRAGGLGINLASADVVILYDSDWNPQMDLQAMDRCHRIGQTKQVRVFRLVTSGTVEEKIVERAEIKLHLDRIVIQQGRLMGERQDNAPSPNDLLSMIRFGAEKILAETSANSISDESIDEILEKSRAKSQSVEMQFGSMEETALLRKFTLEAPPITVPLSIPDKIHKSNLNLSQFEGQDYKNLRELKRKRDRQEGYEGLVKRQRLSGSKTPLRFFGSSTERRKSGISQRTLDMKVKPKLFYDFQFCSPRLFELYYQELDYFHKKTAFKYKMASMNDSDLEQYDIDRQTIEGEPLTLEEVEEKEILSKLTFDNWYEGNVSTYLTALRRTGPNYFSNHEEVILKNPKGRAAYHRVFMERHHELSNFLELLLDHKLDWLIPDAICRWTDLLSWKVQQKKSPTDALEIVYDPPEWMGRRFKLHHDQQLLVLLCNSNFHQRRPFVKMHEVIARNTDNLFDSFLRSRSVQELHARCIILFYLLEQERNKEFAIQNEVAATEGEEPLLPSIEPSKEIGNEEMCGGNVPFSETTETSKETENEDALNENHPLSETAEASKEPGNEANPDKTETPSEISEILHQIGNEVNPDDNYMAFETAESSEEIENEMMSGENDVSQEALVLKESDFEETSNENLFSETFESKNTESSKEPENEANPDENDTSSETLELLNVNRNESAGFSKVTGNEVNSDKDNVSPDALESLKEIEKKSNEIGLLSETVEPLKEVGNEEKSLQKINLGSVELKDA